MLWYHYIAAFIHCHLVQMRATQRDSLAILAAALLGRRALVISELVRAAMPQLPEGHHQRKSVSGASSPTTTLPRWPPDAP